MTAQQQLHELERLAEILEVKVCYEPMAGLVQGTGGLCRVRGQYRVIIDKKLRAPERVNILADALRRFDVAGLEMAPHVRRFPSIDTQAVWQRPGSSPTVNGAHSPHCLKWNGTPAAAHAINSAITQDNKNPGRAFIG